MAKPFDSTLSTLIDARPGDWTAYLAARCGLPPGPATPLDTDLSATLQADRLVRVDAPVPYALHLEFEVSSRLGLPARLLRYNVAAWAANDLPVRSVLVLMRPEARASDQTGVFELVGPGEAYLTFRYDVVRVWEEPMAQVLAPLGTVPLSVVTDEAAADLPAAARRIRERLRQPDVSAMLAKDLLHWTNVLAGLRYDEDTIRGLAMSWNEVLEASSVIQGAMARGRSEGKDQGMAEGKVQGALQNARATILRLAAKRFGPPSAAAEAAVRDEADRDRLDRLLDRVLDATGWDDLVATT